MRRIYPFVAAFVLLCAANTTALAKGGVELVTVAEVEVVQKSDKNGNSVIRMDAAKANVAPGDTVIFTVTCSNRGDQPAGNIVINNPVPEHMTYQDQSAEGSGTAITFSVDNGKSYGQIAQLKVKAANGKVRNAQPADVTNVKWTLEKPLPGGAKKSVSYRAKVK